MTNQIKLKLGTYHNSRVKDYFNKDRILQSYYNQYPPIKFLQSVYNTNSPEDKVLTTLVNNPPKKRFKKYDDVTDLYFENYERDDCVIYFSSYFSNYYKDKNLKTIKCLVVDVDNVSTLTLYEILKSIHNYEVLKPSFIFNSGNGVQLYYQIEPVEVPNNRFTLKLIHRRLNESLLFLEDIEDDTLKNNDKKIKIDSISHNFSHPYGLTGSSSKIQIQTHLYQSGDIWDLETLMFELGIPDRIKSTEELNNHPKRKIKTTDNQEKIIDFTRINNLQKWYYQTLLKVKNDTKIGFRYTSCMSLWSIGIKTFIPIDQLKQDIRNIGFYWSKKFNDQKIKENVLKVFSMSINKSRMVTSRTLEGWMGWSFKRKLTTKERNFINNKKRIKRLLNKTPDISIRNICLKLKLSHNTVRPILKTL